VIGTISDYAGSSARKYASAARRALAVSDHVVFIGPHAHHALKGDDGSGSGQLYGFRTLPEAVDHLRCTVSAGDLVLLEGSRADGLGAVITEIAP
jgi:UDP-N-acetylmuramyl pentapeptide synthase